MSSFNSWLVCATRHIFVNASQKNCFDLFKVIFYFDLFASRGTIPLRTTSTDMDDIEEKLAFWRQILLQNNHCHANFKDCSQEYTSTLAAGDASTDWLLVRVRDESSQYILQSSDNTSTVVTREEARRILTSNSRCKLLCEYIQQHKEDSENWDLRLILFLENSSAEPRYYVEFTEQVAPHVLNHVREVSAQVNVKVDVKDRFEVHWDLTITRGQ